MSTIVSVKKNGLACIASDSLTKYGSTYESEDYVYTNGKIIQIGENFIASVGHASLDLVLSTYFYDKKIDFSSRKSIFLEMLKLHQSLKDDYYLNCENDDGQFESMNMQLLITNPYGIFGVYDLRSVQEYKRFYAFGTGEDYALGAMFCAYDHYDDAVSIAQIGIEAASAFDDGTGLPMHSHKIKLSDRNKEEE